jgi:GNAT superfamily N-acetyltransferase
MPAALASQGFSTRPETDDDTPFLISLYASTREAELAPVPWTPEQKNAFLLHQFHAQRSHYREHIPACAFLVIEKHGAPVGRLYLEPRVTQIHMVDIALTPDQRNRGAGSAIIQAVIDLAAAQGKGVGIFVERFNPALNLYRRFGFTEIVDTGLYLEMEWVAQAA